MTGVSILRVEDGSTEGGDLNELKEDNPSKLMKMLRAHPFCGLKTVQKGEGLLLEEVIVQKKNQPGENGGNSNTLRVNFEFGIERRLTW